MEWTKRSQTKAGIGLAFAVLVGIDLLSYYSARVVIRTGRSVRSRYQALIQLEATLSTLQGAETARRGYIMTGDHAQLASLTNTSSRLTERFRLLKQLTADDPQQQRWLVNLKSLTARELDQLIQSIELRELKKPDLDDQALLTEKGKEMMDAIQHLIRQMELEENEVLDQEETELEARTRYTAHTVLVGTLGGIGLLLLVFYFLNTEIRERKRAEVEVHKLNRELGSRFIERTTKLREANRELQNQIDERRRIEEALKKSEASYRSLIMGATYGIFRCSVNGKFLAVNPALVSMLGYESEMELMKMNLLYDVFRDPIEGNELVQKCQQTARLDGLEVEWKGKAGAIVPVRLSGRAFMNDRGALQGFELIAENVAERRRLEEQFRQAQKMEAVGRLAGGIAHDFNNLLTIIIGYSQLLSEGLGAENPLRGAVEEVKKAGERAASLTTQLLAFSRRQVLQPQVLDLNSVATNVQKMLRRLIGEDVEVVLNLAPDLGRVRADPGQIEQVIMNLAVNARDAMPQGGKFILTTANVELDHASARRYILAAPGPHVVLSVADTGCGMDATTRSHIFEPFFTTKEKGKGTGLGLAMVYGIVRQSGGNIWVDSELGKGTTFELYFPRVDEAVKREGASCSTAS
jgi:PAS domain S-box-containing protein